MSKDVGMGIVPKLRTKYFVKNTYQVWVRVYAVGHQATGIDILIGSEPTEMRAIEEVNERNRRRT